MRWVRIEPMMSNGEIVDQRPGWKIRRIDTEEGGASFVVDLDSSFQADGIPEVEASFKRLITEAVEE